jgi:hypothetical protein
MLARHVGGDAGRVDHDRAGPRRLGVTHGVTEAENSQSAQFGINQLERTILEMRGQPARRVVDRHALAAPRVGKRSPRYRIRRTKSSIP